MSTANYVIGIDLGTTNTVASFAPIKVDASIELLPIFQMVSQGESAAYDRLPSVAFVESDALSDSMSALPWSTGGTVLGRFARRLVASQAHRCIVSAKSWLSYGGVDRQSPILPWGAASDIPKFSPVAVSALYLAQIVESWKLTFPTQPIEEQEVVLTVPASFDDTARRLTVDAARKAGLTGDLFLIEEPQSAFYDHLTGHTSELKDGDLVLIVDVGGGTTDLTLLRKNAAFDDSPGGLERVAVGEHLLLGGDNMDLLLAYEAEHRIVGRSGTLTMRMMSQLVSACRTIKEGAFAEKQDVFTVTLPSRGSSLIQGTRSCEFTAEEIIRLISDAFLPSVPMDVELKRSSGLALSALGLPYEADPVLTKHVAAFLRKHSDFGYPSHVLFNGGVFQGASLRGRLIASLNEWAPEGTTVSVLGERDLNSSVARGASAYGLARHGFFERIGGGVTQNYFVAVDRRNKKGKKKGRSGLCVLPKGTATDKIIELDSTVFELVSGRPIQLNIWCGGGDAFHIGETKADDWDGFYALPPIKTVISSHEDAQIVPVTLSARMSELGLLELSARAVDRHQVFQFEFDDSHHSSEIAGSDIGETVLDLNGVELVESHLARVFGKPDPSADPKEIRHLSRTLEVMTGRPRDKWDLQLLRSLYDVLLKGLRRRRRSERHELTFFHLAGFCLRPGQGDSFDEWRVERIWAIFNEGVHFHQRLENWDAWWVLWRRIAGGLNAQQQRTVYGQISPWLERYLDDNLTKKDKLRQPLEAMRLLASLERIEAQDKARWGERFLGLIEANYERGLVDWCLARIGARELLGAGAEFVVDARCAEAWLERLLRLEWPEHGLLEQCVISLARCTGDRSRDINPSLRERVCGKLRQNGANATAIDTVSRPVQIRVEDSSQIFGDRLPDGLRLVF